MDATDFIKGLRRRWAVLAVTVAAALGVAGLTTTVAPAGPPVRTYQGTAVLLNLGFTSFSGYDSLETMAALTTVGEVPERVAASIGYEGDPIELTGKVQAVANKDTGLISISATSTDPQEAKLLADSFATELVGFLGSRRTETTAREAESVRRRLDKLENEIANLDQRIATGSLTEAQLLTAQRDAKLNQYRLAYEQFSQLAAVSDDVGSLQIIQDAFPQVLPDQGFIQVRSLPSRLILAAILGLLAGAGLVFALEHFDTRIRNKREAEEAFELPVLSEIPVLPKRKAAEAGVAVASKPKSLWADSFRILAAAIARRPPQVPKVILITSPGPSEGKTTVVANLAATYAEVGRKVLVISCDLHRPQVHQPLGVPNTRGLTEMLRTMEAEPAGNGKARKANGLILDGNVWKTKLDNVRVIPSGSVPEKPAELLASESMRVLLAQAREVADVILIDTPPILAVSDATHLFPETDAVLVVASAGRTTSEAAQRTNELLLRLGAPALGVALNGVTEVALPRGYYHYYERRPEGGRARRGTAASLSRRSGF